jgi:hypothetical protein
MKQAPLLSAVQGGEKRRGEALTSDTPLVCFYCG